MEAHSGCHSPLTAEGKGVSRLNGPINHHGYDFAQETPVSARMPKKTAQRPAPTTPAHPAGAPAAGPAARPCLDERPAWLVRE
jgi:hypothetical protein